jgi:hypothetical protein
MTATESLFFGTINDFCNKICQNRTHAPQQKCIFIRSSLVAGEQPHGPCNPFCGRICCDVDPDKVSACEPDDDQDIEQVEANGRNNEQVHGGDVRCVVTQEGAPSLGRRSTSLDHVLRDAGLSDLEAELEQLAMDTEARKI